MNIEEIRAHPRVCGENYTENAPVRSSAGSSPRVRGKRECSSLGRIRCGLIPACAGKTPRRRISSVGCWAHPRVCGENCRCSQAVITSTGSSPRVRGKPKNSRTPRPRVGLIPACAGKTVIGPFRSRRRGAHPRVCGENGGVGELEGAREGSSPRVRGKRLRLGRRGRGSRLIPACAGKTEAAA